ncbi:MAG: hypothetical protein JW967_03670 [Dehalococcoidales bacterium]|nr:hypothetical protein [Dehalococcoidales bacterium]
MGNNGMISGILSIVSGFFGLLYGALYIVMIFFMDNMFNFIAEVESTPFTKGFDSMFDFVYILYGTMGVVIILIGILAIIGGVYSIKRKYWGLGLAAAIAATITFFPCGIAAIILISLGKSEFDHPAAVPPAVQHPLQQ